MSDRLLTELVIVPLLMKDAVIVGIDPQSMPQDYDRLMIFLNRAILQVVEDLPEPRQGKVIRRANRLFTDIVAPYKTSDVLGLVVFCLVRLLTETGYLEIGQTSPLWQACNLFIPVGRARAGRGVDGGSRSRCTEDARCASGSRLLPNGSDE